MQVNGREIPVEHYNCSCTFIEDEPVSDDIKPIGRAESVTVTLDGRWHGWWPRMWHTVRFVEMANAIKRIPKLVGFGNN